MQRTAEAVSLGHPDKIADYISSYILDRLIEQDPLNIKQWGIIVALAFLIIPLDMIRKMLIKHKIIF